MAASEPWNKEEDRTFYPGGLRGAEGGRRGYPSIWKEAAARAPDCLLPSRLGLLGQAARLPPSGPGFTLGPGC